MTNSNLIYMSDVLSTHLENYLKWVSPSLPGEFDDLLFKISSKYFNKYSAK